VIRLKCFEINCCLSIFLVNNTEKSNSLFVILTCCYGTAGEHFWSIFCASSKRETGRARNRGMSHEDRCDGEGGVVARTHQG